MSSNELIDAQFDRAVEIVQGLPKTGPIQTDYEEKLTMYSLYKQATVGNVKSPRPGIWDMLGRAKWDAWAKHKDVDSFEAKWLYVEALIKVLRKYSDKTIAKTLVEELESYGGDPSNIIMSRTLSSKSPDSESSGSTASDDAEVTPPYPRTAQSQGSLNVPRPQDAESSTDEEDTDDDEAHELPAVQIDPGVSQVRSQSAMSSYRYRTPMAGSLAMSPPPGHTSAPMHGIPSTQPLPGFETPSAFAEPSPISIPTSLFPTGSSSYVGQFSESSRAELTSPPNIYPAHPHYRGVPQAPSSIRPYGPVRPISRPTLEHAVEHVQSQIAALNERLESLESISHHPSRSHISLSPRGVNTPIWAGRGSPTNGRDNHEWDLDDLGMWSMVLNPVSRGIVHLRELAKFFARNENRSPSLIILRRLCLDVSFLLSVLGVLRMIWKKSGVRRREVYAALVVLWRAILGSKQRTMVERGV